MPASAAAACVRKQLNGSTARLGLFILDMIECIDANAKDV